MTVTNTYEEAARKAKAAKLANVLRAMNATADKVESMDGGGWYAAEQLAEVHPASERTREMSQSDSRLARTVSRGYFITEPFP